MQAPKHSCSEIRDSLDKHLVNMGQKLEEMTDEEFKTGVDSVLTIVSEKDKNQKEEFTRFWAELNRHKYQFDRQEKEI